LPKFLNIILKNIGNMHHKKLEEDIYRYAVRNAFLHNGKASVKAVVGKILSLYKEAKAKDVVNLVAEVVEKVNSMTFEEIKREYDKFKHTYELKPKQKEKYLPELEWAKKEKVVTRFAPNPNAPFHIGNARAAILSYEYAKMYNGKFILRFDDTDPKIKKPLPNAEQLFKEDLSWLGCKVDETYFASDRLEIYYKYMKKLVEIGKAYVCVCDVEKWRELVKQNKACPCRSLDETAQMERLQKMFDHTYKEGQAVLRLKTDLMHKDPSVRDFWLARVVDNVQHPNPKVKDKHVWPSYNLASAIDDHLLGVTLILRGQEHEQNKTKQEFIYKYLGWVYPHCIHFGRLNLKGVVLSKSKIVEGIAKGLYTGFDDPRLGTIRALRRRGIQAEAIRKIILELGVKSSDATISIEKLYNINRDLIDPIADRVVFISNPMYLKIAGSVPLEVKLPKHPDIAARGFREYSLEKDATVIVSKDDIARVSLGEVFRLRKAYDVKLSNVEKSSAEAEFLSVERTNKKAKLLLWLHPNFCVNTVLVMDDGSTIEGLAERYIIEKSVGTIVQLEGFGYARIDKKDKERVVCYFSHK